VVYWSPCTLDFVFLHGREGDVGVKVGIADVRLVLRELIWILKIQTDIHGFWRVGILPAFYILLVGC
jgi:hypothetical protein